MPAGVRGGGYREGHGKESTQKQLGQVVELTDTEFARHEKEYAEGSVHYKLEREEEDPAEAAQKVETRTKISPLCYLGKNAPRSMTQDPESFYLTEASLKSWRDAGKPAGMNRGLQVPAAESIGPARLGLGVHAKLVVEFKLREISVNAGSAQPWPHALPNGETEPVIDRIEFEPPGGQQKRILHCTGAAESGGTGRSAWRSSRRDPWTGPRIAERLPHGPRREPRLQVGASEQPSTVHTKLTGMNVDDQGSLSLQAVREGGDLHEREEDDCAPRGLPNPLPACRTFSRACRACRWPCRMAAAGRRPAAREGDRLDFHEQPNEAGVYPTMPPSRSCHRVDPTARVASSGRRITAS